MATLSLALHGNPLPLSLESSIACHCPCNKGLSSQFGKLLGPPGSEYPIVRYQGRLRRRAFGGPKQRGLQSVVGRRVVVNSVAEQRQEDVRVKEGRETGSQSQVPEEAVADSSDSLGKHTVVEAVVETITDVAEVTAKTVASVGEFEVLEPPVDAAADKSSALKTVAFWVSAAVLFGTGIGFSGGLSKSSEFFAGYLLEQSLSVDNLLVFVLIFNYFKVPQEYQPRVLTYGIAGAVLFRAIMIGLGVATLQTFNAINLVFAGILLFSSYKLLSENEEDDNEDLSSNFVVQLCQKVIPVTGSYDGDKFFTVVDGIRRATPLLLTLAVVETSDIAFAVDSIPAVFGVTKDPLIVFSSNIFAILGLRSLYTVISGSLDELDYLQPSVAIVLGFIGGKMVSDYFGFHVPTESSLAVVASVLGSGVFLSLKYPKHR